MTMSILIDTPEATLIIILMFIDPILSGRRSLGWRHDSRFCRARDQKVDKAAQARRLLLMSTSRELQPRSNPSRRVKRKQAVLTSALPECKFRLDVLSDDELQRVERNLSTKPRNFYWQPYVAPEDVLRCLRMGGRYVDAARRSFRALELTCFVGTVTTHLIVETGYDFENFRFVLDLLVGLGATLSSLTIKLRTFPPSLYEWLGNIAQIFCLSRYHFIWPCTNICTRSNASVLFFQLFSKCADPSLKSSI